MSFIDDLLFTCKHVLNDENHFLNASIQHIFERLASQCINSKNLKEYLRLGTLFDLEECQNPEESALVPLSRVKCLISMTSPRDNRLDQSVSFVEFNMLVERFGCLFLPSISTTPSIVAMGMVSVGNVLSVNGGVGTGERVFPPQSGLSYSTWMYIEKFPSNSKTPHPIRILTLIKHFKIKDTLSSCLTINLSPKNRSFFINTEETLLQQFKFDEKVNDYSTKFNCSELFQERQWLHLRIVLNRAVNSKPNCRNASALKVALRQWLHLRIVLNRAVNSKFIGTQRLNYINSTIMPNTMPSSLSIHDVIGTLPVFRSLSSVTWRQANCYLFEDIISYQSVQCIFNMGPNYLGSFQSLEMENFNNSLIMEDRIIKSIAKQLNILSNEKVTPLRILTNTAAQLQGPSRTVGGVVIGYMGVRVFQPMPVSKSIENIGVVGFY
ncbi:unnamed protein product [Brachionus calyciflorus]|uniref:Uncharacterized protein n=1 Tax=Brachionus calyciflorus TaxID=104777 RepID=A0A813Z776_9BILA|nr:unnamed protein product [Brachionus calyciflorus]